MIHFFKTEFLKFPLQVGQYMSESQSLSVSNLAALGNYQNKSAVCSGVCRECHYLFTLQADVFTDGDWIIAGAFGCV